MEILPPWRRRGSKYVAQGRKSDRRINRETRSEVEVEVRSMWRTRDYVVWMPQAGFTYCRTAKRLINWKQLSILRMIISPSITREYRLCSIRVQVKEPECKVVYRIPPHATKKQSCLMHMHERIGLIPIPVPIPIQQVNITPKMHRQGQL